MIREGPVLIHRARPDPEPDRGPPRRWCHSV